LEIGALLDDEGSLGRRRLVVRAPKRRLMLSRPGEFHPEPLTEPYVNLSIHTARVTARRLPPSIDCRARPVAG